MSHKVMSEEEKAKIDAMSHEELARIWRFSPLGCFPFLGEAWDYYVKRFDDMGGMTVEISKRIGWTKGGHDDDS